MKTFICTIVASNYLAQAVTLARTVKDHSPESDFHVLVVDADRDVVDTMLRKTLSNLPPIHLVDLRSLNISGVNSMVARYSPVELSTAVKPFLLTWLLDRGYEGGIYLDPDIWVMGKLDEVLHALQEHEIVVTPHLLEPLPEDGKKPNNETILLAGTYNLGFLGIAGKPEARRFLIWWADVLREKCFLEPQEGYHVDQKWVDLAVGYLQRVYICRNPAYNVAYWNLHERDLSVSNGQFKVNGQPLIFFHFSGYKPSNPGELSVFQDRQKIVAGSPLHRLLHDYTKLLKANGLAKFSPIPYKLSPNGSSGDSGTAVLPRIVVAGYLNRVLGLGAAARNMIVALRKAGLDVSTQTYDAGTNSPLLPEGWADHRVSLFFRSMPRTNIVVVNADQAGLFEETVGQLFFEGAYNIGVWNWELPEFPEEWTRAANRYQEIWVLSSFAQQSVAQRVCKPVLTMPCTISLPKREDVVAYDRRHFGIPNDAYVFLFLFDFFSVFERKNPLGVIQAFAKAFSQDASVHLVIKAVNGHFDRANEALLKSTVKGMRNVQLLDTPLSAVEVTALMNCADCYVSLHRSEGFGLTMAEAMALGKPVIATGWSGNVDLMTINNSFLVGYTLQTLKRDFGPYKAGNMWAEPDLEHAAYLMREVRENPEQSRQIALRGAQTIHDRFSLEAVGRWIVSRISVITGQDAPSPWRQSSAQSTAFPERGRLLHQASLIDLGKVPLPRTWLRRTAKRVIRRGVSSVLWSSLEQARAIATEHTRRIFDLDARIQEHTARFADLEKRLEPVPYRNASPSTSSHVDGRE